jgi:hypothetical protein
MAVVSQQQHAQQEHFIFDVGNLKSKIFFLPKLPKTMG